jgi:choline kinase
MQIVIPMSGFGERFLNAGFKIPKFLINVHGKTIIEHVTNLFSKDCKFIFICNEKHLADKSFDLRNILQSLGLNSQIISISPHRVGPVLSILEAIDYIDDSSEVIVSYCDFNLIWDFSNFLQYISKHKPDGSIICYKGFHPHSVNSKNYAYIKEAKQVIYDIQEKKPFTTNHINEYASAGLYYFKSGFFLKKYSKLLIADQALKLNNEYYVSLVYKKMLDENLSIHNYPVNYFVQWGTPADLLDYLYYEKAIRLFKSKFNPPCISNNTNLVPMAGKSIRFKNEGYTKSKFLLNVDDKLMYERAFENLPLCSDNIAVKLKLEDINSNNISIIDLDDFTDGQLTTCLMAENTVKKNSILTVGVSDASSIYSKNELIDLYKFERHDAIVWGIADYPWAKYSPNDFSWIELNSNNFINRISLKTPLSTDLSGYIVSGIFSFKSADFFFEMANKFKSNNNYYNGELYIDEFINYLISCSYKIKLLPLESYFGWGTPKEYKTFNYWLEYYKL